MHKNTNIRKTLALTAVSALAAGALIAPAIASAKTYKVKATVVAKVGPNLSLKGTVKGKPIGKCTYKGKLEIPNTTGVWKCKGGTITVFSKGTSGASNDARADWKVLKGTGKFKKAKGKGKVVGKLSTATYKYTGTLTY